MHPTNATTTTFCLSLLTAEIYPSGGPYTPPAPVAPGKGAPPFGPPLPPPSIFVGAVASMVVDVTEELFATVPLAVLLPVCDELPAEADRVGVIVKTIGCEMVICCLFVPENWDVSV